MRTIERSTAFKKDFKRESRGQYRKTLDQDITIVLKSLLNDSPLELKYRDHDLIGNLGRLPRMSY